MPTALPPPDLHCLFSCFELKEFINSAVDEAVSKVCSRFDSRMSIAEARVRGKTRKGRRAGGGAAGAFEIYTFRAGRLRLVSHFCWDTLRGLLGGG